MTDEYGFSDYPWSPQEGETSTAYAAFIAYRDLGPRRTMRAAAAKFYPDDFESPEDVDPKSGKVRNFERWSSRWRWVARCEEWDTFLQKQADADEVQAVKDMRARHVNMMTVMQSKAVQYLNTITEEDLRRMTPDTAMRMLDLAIKNERLARNVPDTIQAQTDVNGGPVQATVEISVEALERRFDAWKAAHDPNNVIEKGEPDRPDADDLNDAPEE